MPVNLTAAEMQSIQHPLAALHHPGKEEQD
jgi:hypothetical protein